MHLGKALHVQYYYWAKGALQGDLGKSLVTKRNVSEDIWEFLPASLELALYSGIFMGIMGITLGALSGWYKNSWIDNAVRLFSYIGIVTPSFVFAIFFVLVFGHALEILPTIGRVPSGATLPTRITGILTFDALVTGNITLFLIGLKHLLLPALSLAMGPMSQEARITRTTIANNLENDYVAAERASGLPERIIMFKYLLKPSLIPTISIYALDFAAIVGNAFVVELIFNWPGLSRYGMNAMLQKDLNAVVAVVLVYGVLFMIVNFIVDLTVGFLDPRIRLGEKSSE
jgi:peptide/nickel transport system permease protein